MWPLLVLVLVANGSPRVVIGPTSESLSPLCSEQPCERLVPPVGNLPAMATIHETASLSHFGLTMIEDEPLAQSTPRNSDINWTTYAITQRKIPSIHESFALPMFARSGRGTTVFIVGNGANCTTVGQPCFSTATPTQDGTDIALAVRVVAREATISVVGSDGTVGGLLAAFSSVASAHNSLSHSVLLTTDSTLPNPSKRTRKVFDAALHELKRIGIVSLSAATECNVYPSFSPYTLAVGSFVPGEELGCGQLFCPSRGETSVEISASIAAGVAAGLVSDSSIVGNVWLLADMLVTNATLLTVDEDDALRLLHGVALDDALPIIDPSSDAVVVAVSFLILVAAFA